MSLTLIFSHIMNKLPEKPQTAVILGSGLGAFIDSLEKTICIPYSDIPKFPKSTVSGHAGELVFGYIKNIPIICASGRFHVYEGFSMGDVTLPISTIHALGCTSVIITNSSGCLKKEWGIGDFMLIQGYLDYTFSLKSETPKIVTFEKDKQKYREIRSAASAMGLELREGIYTWTLGPSYETPAEIEDIISLGGNAVGMSTVPEIMKSLELGLEITAIACLTNYGAGMHDKKLSHKDVLKTSGSFNKEFSRLLVEIVFMRSSLR